MKPTGSIPCEFMNGDVLAIAGSPVDRFLAGKDTPCFVYDPAIVRARVRRFRSAFPADLQLHYAVKANPFPPLLQQITQLVDGCDVASAGELALALDAGVQAQAISFAGPGKRDREIEAAVTAGATLNVESAGELGRALIVADRVGVRPNLAVRINPAFGLHGSGLRMGGGASPFGVDAEEAAPLIRSLIASGAEWRGLHLYAGTQSLDAQAISAAQAASIELAARLSGEVGQAIPMVNLGGGFGVPYHHGDRELDVEAIGTALGDTLASRPGNLADTSFAVELGRWLVAEAGVYLTRIVDRKVSRGQTFLVTDGGLHHQLSATGNFGSVVRRNYPVAIANRYDAPPSEIVTVVGCLCTPLDRLADQVLLPHADVGDIVAIFMAGAYGATASPSGFLSHPAALEILA